MSKLPSLKNLNYLIALHQQQNFNRAAAACNVSQSTLSSGIQNLEEQLGCQLIERDHKSFLFTALGEEVVEQARKIITSTEELMHYAKGHGNIMEGPVRLGIIPTIAPFVVAELSRRVQANFAKLDLQISEDTTANLLSALRDGELDILLLALPMDIHGNQKWLLGRDPFKLVAHKEIADQLGEPVDYDKLPDGSIFLLEKEHCLTGHAVAACQLTDTVKVNPFTATSLHSLVQMADAKKGQPLCHRWQLTVASLIHDLKPLKPAGQEAFRDIGMVYRPTTSRRQTFRKLAELIAPLLPVSTLN